MCSRIRHVLVWIREKEMVMTCTDFYLDGQRKARKNWLRIVDIRSELKRISPRPPNASRVVYPCTRLKQIIIFLLFLQVVCIFFEDRFEMRNLLRAPCVCVRIFISWLNWTARLKCTSYILGTAYQILAYIHQLFRDEKYALKKIWLLEVT